jgi:predicted CopG family antitoxin
MTTKTITITEKAYSLLKQKKRKNESFSDVIIKHFSEKQSILDLFGAWEGDDKEWESIYAGINSAWKSWNLGNQLSDQ